MQPPTFVIRRVEPADAAVVAGHRVAMFRDMGQVAEGGETALHAATERFIDAALCDGRYVGWLAVDSRDPAAVVGGVGLLPRQVCPGPKPDGRVTDGRQALVVNVYTDRAWRRLGVAERLMRTAIAWTRAESIDVVVLHASVQGRRVYERLGFVPTNEMRLDGAALTARDESTPLAIDDSSTRP